MNQFLKLKRKTIIGSEEGWGNILPEGKANAIQKQKTV